MGLIFVTVLVMGIATCISSESSTMVSVPLGFEISASNRNAWVSQNGFFAFGFLGRFRKGDGFLAGIWYNFDPSEERSPVWTVGNGVRVSENSTLTLSRGGSLILLDRSHGELPLWSSDTDYLGVESMSLLDNGNLVLTNVDHKVVWESFRCPTDTLLPGQSLQVTQSLRPLTTNSIASYYKLQLINTGAISLVWNNITYWTAGEELSTSSVVEEARFEADGLLGLFDAAGVTIWRVLSEDFKDPSVTFRHLKIDSDGNLRIYSWDTTRSSWNVQWQAVQNQCDVFGSCGLYGVCGYNSSSSICSCLSGNTESGGCEKLAGLRNCGADVSLQTLHRTVLYSVYPPHDVKIMLNIKACKDFCLNDSSCQAATVKNDGSGICTITRTNYISGYSYSTVPATAFLKVCLVPEAALAGFVDGHDGIPNPTKPYHSQMGRHKKYALYVALLLITVLVFLTTEMLVFWYIVYRRKQLERETTTFIKDAQRHVHYSTLVRLSFEEVKVLTNNFTIKIKSTTYKGVLPNKMLITAKVLHNIAASERDFQMVISTLGSTHHRNLVSIKGFCYEPEHKIVIYEYINNCSLDQWLFSRKRNRSTDSWNQRVSVLIEVARAVAYLHLECRRCIAHGNLKLENILLDEQLVVKLTDFGLHSLFENLPSSSSETVLERDVYMFGKLLLEVVAGRRDYAGKRLYELAFEMCRAKTLDNFVDAHLEGGADPESVERAVRLALWCMLDQASLRPSIGEALMVLEGSLSLDMPPSFESS